MKKITEIVTDKQQRPERILQFGEGNFLRGFVDWMVDILNEKELFDGSIVLVQPIAQGLGQMINERQGLYTTYLRGLQNGEAREESRLITSISRCINPYSEYEEYIEAGCADDIRYIVSNTTEAGIAYEAEDKLGDAPQKSFPGKLTALLYKRYQKFKGAHDKGVAIIPCELIDRNGDRLRELVLRYADEWQLEREFKDWLNESCEFLVTLVDRIVTGYPRDEDEQIWEKLGYEDNLLVTGELFHLWAIEGSNKWSQELRFTDAGLNVIWTDNLEQYRTRKVRILNGAHTMIALSGHLYGADTVREVVSDPVLNQFLHTSIFSEIIPTMDSDPDGLHSFADSVLERFANPYIVHPLLSISLNSVSKFKARVLPSMIDSIRRRRTLPKSMVLALAGLIAFYKIKDLNNDGAFGIRDGSPYKINDNQDILERFHTWFSEWSPDADSSRLLCEKVLGAEDLWGQSLNDISGLTEQVSVYLHRILSAGMKTVMQEFVQNGEAVRVKKIDPRDNVGIAIDSIFSGTTVQLDGQKVEIVQDIPRGHKFALKQIQTGEPIIKYGYPMGKATEVISPGTHVHTHNVKTGLEGTLEYSYNPLSDSGNLPAAAAEKTAAATFMGFRRPGGKVGIRNEIWIIPTVGCVNRPAEVMAKRVEKLLAKRSNTSIDGIYTFAHPYGCSQLGDDQVMTQKILADLVHHPNAAGVLVLGLGCENNYIRKFKEVIGEYDDQRVKFLAAQDTPDELESGTSLLTELLDYADSFKREAIPASELVVGLKCGGSDGYSGLSANPLLGQFSDRLIAAGGTTILTEVPEMFGAETILMDRAKDEGTFHDVVGLINGFKEYYLRYNQVVYENPSPGNKDGGITTLEEKSLGCVQKGGRSPVTGVMKYGDRVQNSGLNLLEGPGNDIVSVTAMAAAGAHMVLFTTGRGTPLGGPVPTVKVSSNSELAFRKKSWIDFDAGPLLEGQDLVPDFLDYVLSVASGQETNNELNEYREIAIFKDGVTL